MAAKVPEKPVEEKPEEKPAERDPLAVIESGTADGLRWERVRIFGTVYQVREITVDEEDTAQDAADNGDDTWNTRLQSRLQLASAIMDPPTTVDEIATWPGLKRRMLNVVFARLNSLPPADAEGNA